MNDKNECSLYQALMKDGWDKDRDEHFENQIIEKK